MSSKRVTRSKYGNAISFFFLALMGVFIALPIYYSIINAFKPVSELFLFPPRFVVYHPTFENFKNIIRLQSQSTIAVERYIFNSVTVTVIATAGYILIASLAAYPMAKKEFPGKKIISVVIVFAILFSNRLARLKKTGKVIGSLVLMGFFFVVAFAFLLSVLVNSGFFNVPVHVILWFFILLVAGIDFLDFLLLFFSYRFLSKGLNVD